MLLFHRLTYWDDENSWLKSYPFTPPLLWCSSTVLRLVPCRATPLMVPDIVPVFRSAEQPRRLGEPLPVFPLPVSFTAGFGELRTTAKLGGGVAPVVMETRWGQLATCWSGNVTRAGTNRGLSETEKVPFLCGALFRLQLLFLQISQGSDIFKSWYTFF